MLWCRDMANNRLYLKSKRTGKTFYLAKFYPSTGWYVKDEATFGKEFGEFLHEHSFGKITFDYAKAEGIKGGIGNYDGGTMELEWEVDGIDD